MSRSTDPREAAESALAQWRESKKNKDTARARMFRRTLQAWIQNGGARPEGLTPRELSALGFVKDSQ